MVIPLNSFPTKVSILLISYLMMLILVALVFDNLSKDGLSEESLLQVLGWLSGLLFLPLTFIFLAAGNYDIKSVLFIRKCSWKAFHNYIAFGILLYITLLGLNELLANIEIVA
jgi:hypothetical protein